MLRFYIKIDVMVGIFKKGSCKIQKRFFGFLFWFLLLATACELSSIFTTSSWNMSFCTNRSVGKLLKRIFIRSRHFTINAYVGSVGFSGPEQSQIWTSPTSFSKFYIERQRWNIHNLETQKIMHLEFGF